VLHSGGAALTEAPGRAFRNARPLYTYNSATISGGKYAHCCSLGRSSFIPMSSRGFLLGFVCRFSFILTCIVDRITEELRRLERQEELAEEALMP
jgi:hypothetical protein